MEKDCWENLLDNKEPPLEQEGDNAAIMSILADVMKAKAFPGLLQSLPSTVEASLRQLLKDTFQYDSDKRPRAVDLVNTFPS